MDLNSLITIIIIIATGLFFYKYFLKILHKSYPKLLLDSELNKPQAFHEYPISVVGGIGLFFSFLIVFFNFTIFKNLNYFDYLSFCTLFFLLGLADDIKINIYPKIRLVLMVTFLIFLVKYNNFYLENTVIEFLKKGCTINFNELNSYTFIKYKREVK